MFAHERVSSPVACSTSGRGAAALTPLPRRRQVLQRQSLPVHRPAPPQQRPRSSLAASRQTGDTLDQESKAVTAAAEPAEPGAEVPASAEEAAAQSTTINPLDSSLDALLPAVLGIELAELTPAPLQEVPLEQALQSLEVLAKEETSYVSLALWAAAAAAFGGGIFYVEGAGKAQEFFAGYLLEQSLSVDNLFVFVLVFGYFKTPPKLQNKVLTYGILSAGVLRAVMVLLGIQLIEQFRPLLAFFAGILVFSSYKLLTSPAHEEGADTLSSNALVVWCKKYIKASDTYDGDKFFTTAADGVTTIATPLLLVLAVVELSDVVFAVDSIPAVFGVTLDPFIVYTSNIFAILSLRSLYSFVSTVMRELRFLDKAVAVILGFIGAKMLVSFVNIEIPTDVSLLVVGVLLGGGVAASLLLPEDPAAVGDRKH